jgi:hypothetical protein
MQFQIGDSGVEDSVAECFTSSQSFISTHSATPSRSASQRSTPRTHTHHSSSNQEVVSLLLKMHTTLNSLVEITRKLATEGGVKKEDDPKYTVSLL